MRHRWVFPSSDEQVPRYTNSHYWVHECYCGRCKTVFTEALDPNVFQRDDCPGESYGPWKLFDYRERGARL